jgi:hypothetical protein
VSTTADAGRDRAPSAVPESRIVHEVPGLDRVTDDVMSTPLGTFGWE